MTKRTLADAAALFRRIYPHPNCMTPHRVAFGWQASFAWELSRGEGIRIRSIHGDGPVPDIWGVTVLQCGYDTPPVKRNDLNELFESESMARAYIADMFQKRPATDALAALQERAERDEWERDYNA